MDTLAATYGLYMQFDDAGAVILRWDATNARDWSIVWASDAAGSDADYGAFIEQWRRIDRRYLPQGPS